MPALAGNGLAMRAGVMLEALAASHEVSLLVVPVVATSPPGPGIARWCARVNVLDVAGRSDAWFDLIARTRNAEARAAALARYPRPALCRFATRQAVTAASTLVAGPAFDVVHVFRLYLAPFAGPFLDAREAGRPLCALDLDDHESVTRGRLADLHAALGDERAAAGERLEGDKYARMERDWLPRFDRVYVCAEADRRALAEAGVAGATVVPNAVRPPDAVSPPPAGGPRTVLFVGSLGYFPNEAAALLLGRHVAPALRALVPGDVRVRIVGAGPSRRVRALADDGNVEVTGAVPDVAGHYAAAHVVAVPLRAGGGTRIKVLEAFAHGRPVVSTTVGAEGLAVRDGEHLVLADTPEAMAEGCASLLADPARASALAAHARDFVVEHHTIDRVRERLERAIGG
jgi:glycosyltransferase involved in cell wall biosynthesis